MPLSNTANYLNLETISKDGAVPESRLTDPMGVQAIVQQMIHANEKRSKTDARVFGLVSGNPPYSPAKLREEGQAWRANFPSRIGEAFLNVALTSYWDIINEAPTKCEVRTAYGNADQQDEWSGCITEEFERLNQADPCLNYMFRLSQYDMVLYRNGPVIFDDFYGIYARAIQQSHLLVEDGAPSNVEDWVIAAARVRYKAHELYGFIRNPEAARKIGFDVKEVRKALMDYADSSFWPAGTRNRDWIFYEQRIRNNDLYISRISEEIPVAHVWYREFPKKGEPCGRISHCMIIENGEPSAFLFRKVGRYEKWQNIIHPFYYDTGDGTHHSVKGLGIKAYAALAHYDRLQCHLADMALFAGIHFQARDAAAMQNLAVQAMGPYIVHPPGTDLLNIQIGGNLEAPLAIKQDFLNTLTSNLAQYRQDVQRRRQGSAEPPTARQINYESANEGVINKSGMTWYCEQLDPFWSERFRRCSNPNIIVENPGGKEALAFQKACKARGVPPEALAKIDHVRATRTIGMGSADNRMQSMVRLFSRIGAYDENGRRKILENITAADVGWSQMRQYIRKQPDSPYAADQRSEASQWVGSMKVGVAPEGSPSWNPVIFAGVWLKAATDAVAGLQQGANPMEVASFLEIIGPAIRKQLDRIASDESRNEVYKEMDKMWRKLSGIHDQLVAQIQKQQQAQMKQRQQLAQQANQTNGELAIKAAESRGKLQISKEKKDENMQMRREVHNQKLALDAQKATQQAAISDIETSVKIRNDTATARAKTKKSSSQQ